MATKSQVPHVHDMSNPPSSLPSQESCTVVSSLWPCQARLGWEEQQGPRGYNPSAQQSRQQRQAWETRMYMYMYMYLFDRDRHSTAFESRHNVWLQLAALGTIRRPHDYIFVCVGGGRGLYTAYQGSPQAGIKAEGWVWFVTTSIDSLPTSKLETNSEGIRAHSAKGAWGEL